jgi:hypothetical protein
MVEWHTGKEEPLPMIGVLHILTFHDEAEKKGSLPINFKTKWISYQQKSQTAIYAELWK